MNFTDVPYERPEPKKGIKRTDEELNEVYSLLIKYKPLALSDDDKDMLLNRGLSIENIKRNQYRTIPEAERIPEDEYIGFKNNKIPWEKAPMHFSEISAGIKLASDIQNWSDISLDGVPGFFKYMDKWCFRWIPGLMIPCRNKGGLIIGFQIKTSNPKSPKYMTLSSGNLPNGTSGGSRLHFPIINGDWQEVRITEGPLKADVATALDRKGILYISIPGIASTNDVPTIIEILKNRNIKKVYNALDMDKFTNENVIRGAHKLNKLFRDAGIEPKMLCWDRVGAKQKLEYLQKVAEENEIELDLNEKEIVFGQVYSAAAALIQNDAPFNAKWRKECKGVDDFLYNRQFAVLLEKEKIDMI